MKALTSRPASSTAKQWVPLITIALLALALRLYHLDGQSFWSDEGLSVHYASPPVSELLQRITVGFHNPLYFLSLHFWMELTGKSDWAIRFCSLWASVLAVPLLYTLGRLLYDRRAGLLAALLLAVNPFAIYYAQEARMYALILALSLGSVVCFVLAVRRDRLLAWVGFVLFTVACLYTHYFAALAPVAAAVYFVVSWLRGRYRPHWQRWLLAHVAVVVLYIPWLRNALSMTSAESWQKPIPPLLLPVRTLGSFSLGEVFPFAARDWLTVAFGLLFLLGLYGLHLWSRRSDSQDSLLLPLYLAVPLLLMMLLTWTGRGVLDKYLTVILPPFCLVLALGVLTLGRIKWPLALLGVLFIAGSQGRGLYTYFTDPRTFKPDYRATAAHITALEQPGDVILADGLNPDIIFGRYYRGKLPIHRVDLGEPADEEALLGQLASQYGRAWLVLHFHEPGRIEYWLEKNGYQIDRDEFSTIKLYLYSLPKGEDGVPVSPPLSQETKGPVRLTGYRLFPNPAPSGDVAHLSLIWQTDTPPGVNYRVSARLTDTAGRVIWSRDRSPIEGIVPSATWLPARPITDSLGIPVPVGTLPGDYGLTVVLYDPTSGSEVVKAPLGPLHVVRPAQPPTDLAHRWPKGVTVPPSPLPFGSAVELLAYEIPVAPAQAGGTLSFFLIWRAHGRPQSDAEALLQLHDRQGNIQSEERASHATYPLTAWTPGEVVRFPYTLKVAPALLTSRYDLTVNLIDPVSGQPLRPEPARLGEVSVQSRPRSYKLSGRLGHTVNVQIGEGIRLLGYDLSAGDVRPGSTVGLTLYWQALAPLGTSYTVFTHLLNSAGQMVAGKDSPPLGGEAPTTGWLKDEVLTDRYDLAVPPDAAPGTYPIELGLYDPDTGQRLPVSRDGSPQPSDRLLLDETVTVR